MKKLSLLIFAVFAFSSGCIENPKVVIEKPFFDLKGRYETIATPKGGTPPVLLVEINGEGQASHLGKSTFIALTNLNVTPPPPFKITATSTMVSANGDELYTEAHGTVMPLENDNRKVTVYHTIVGGTGKFKNAKGQFVGIGEADVITGIGYLEIEGKISY